jgi:predicted peptidase
MTTPAAKRIVVTLALFAALTSTASAQRGVLGRGGIQIGRGRVGNGPGQEIREHAALIRRIETRDYLLQERNERIEYSIFVSSRVDWQKPSPLVIALHDLGDRPSAMLRVIVREAEERGYIVAAPMGYNLEGWYGANGMTSDQTDPPNLGELSENDVMHVLEIMRKDYNVDEHRIYLLGQSMGGAGALHLGSKYPDVWAAVAASAPAFRPQQQPDQLQAATHLPMMLVQGTADRPATVEQTRLWVARLKELKMTHEYFEIRGGGHNDALSTGAERMFKFFDRHRKPEKNPALPLQ